MKNLLVFVRRMAASLIGSLLILAGAAQLWVKSPTTLLGWILVGVGLAILRLILWPTTTAGATVKMPISRFSYDQELKAADARQVVHITYRDKSGRVSERDIEVYRPRDDSHVYAYCRSRKEPRTFLVGGILDWTLTGETFLWNPLVEEWFEHEGRKGSDEREDWQDWIAAKQHQPVPPGRTLYKLKP